MLKDKCAIVTGASRGIGRAIAKKLASLGANIVLNYRSNDEEALKVKEELLSYGVDVFLYKCDISDFNAVEEMIKASKEKFGKVDIMINNAGITKDTLLLRMKEEDFDKVIEVNLKGVFNCLKAITPVMIRQKCGKIVNLSSVVGLVGNAGQVNYAASKAGLIGFTKSVAREVAARGVRVNAIAPGFIESDMTDAIPEKMKDAMIAQVPMKRIGQAEEVAEVAAFLASQEYLTGQTIAIDGGMTMQ